MVTLGVTREQRTEFSETEANQTTTSASYVTVHTHTVQGLVTGDAVVFWSCEQNGNNAGQIVQVRVQHNTTDLFETLFRPSDVLEYHGWSGLRLRPLARDDTITVAHNAGGGSTSTIRRIRVLLLKI